MGRPRATTGLDTVDRISSFDRAKRGHGTWASRSGWGCYSGRRVRLRRNRFAAEGHDEVAVRGEGPVRGAGVGGAPGPVRAGPELVRTVGVTDDLVVR